MIIIDRRKKKKKRQIGEAEEALGWRSGNLDSSVGFDAHLLRSLRQGGWQHWTSVVR